MDCRSRISAGKNTAFSNFREKAANRSRSPDLCIRGGERLLGVAPMADFRLAPGLCTYSGGTVPELHRIVYSPPTPDRRRGHSGFDKNMIRQFRSFVKKAGGIAAKQWFVARASVGGRLPVDPYGGVYKPVLSSLVTGRVREPMDLCHLRSVIGKRPCLFCFGLFWQCILDENRDTVLLYMEKNEVNSMVNILVADDDKNTRLLMKAILEGAGYHVTVAVDGQDALDILEKEHIDLVVLDVMMPRMDGYAFTETIRAGNSNLPILMVSAKQLPTDKHKGFLVGTDDYITKPVDEEEMLLRIKALLRRAKIANDRRIVIGNVVLDYDSFTVSRPGQTQELPQKEFLLLYKLLSYPGKIFTRSQLMDEIWGMDCETGWETVTVHVGRLRKRFEGWDEFSVESVRGLGYKAVKKE